MILYNAINQDVETDNHYLPSIHVNGPSTSLLAFVTGHANVKATWSTGVASPTTPDVMATFSSRGPLGDFVKPDVTAPGIQVLAGTTAQPDADDRRQRPARQPVHGDRRHLDVVPARGRRRRARQGGASRLDAGRDQVGADDLVGAEVVKEDGSTPAEPFDVGAGSIRADGPSTRRSSSTRPTRTTSPRRPIPAPRHLNLASVVRADDARRGDDPRR